MKHHLERLSHKYVVEKAGPLFTAFLLTISGLSGYFYYTKVQIHRLADAIREGHELVRDVSNINEKVILAHHRISAVAYQPTAQTLTGFNDDLIALNKDRAHLHQHYQSQSQELQNKVAANLKQIEEKLGRLELAWRYALDVARKGQSEEATEQAVRKAEDLFRSSHLSAEMSTLMRSQLNAVVEDEAKIIQLGQMQGITVSCGLGLALFLGVVIALLYRLVIRGQANELQLAHSSKLASIGELSAGVSHELNTPLMLIKGFNERIRSTLAKSALPFDSKVLEYIQEVDNGVERMIKIVHHFREFSRLSDHEDSDVEINSIIEDSFSLLAAQLTQTGVIIHRNYTSSNPHVRGDATRLKQAFFNLISNARDAFDGTHDEKERILTVSTWVNDELVVIDVEDNGPGIPATVMDRIFDPFFTTKPFGKGTGLGLSVVQGIVRDHDGEIRVRSHVGGGTKFSISLPRIKQERKIS